MISFAERIAIIRANEQIEHVIFDGRHEKDTFAITGPSKARAIRKGAHLCRATDCPYLTTARSGYCRIHNARLKRGLPLDRTPGEPGRVPRSR